MILPWHQSAFLEFRKMIDQNHLPHALLITGVKKSVNLNLQSNLFRPSFARMTLVKNVVIVEL